MKKIDNYIIEKFKISKNIKINMDTPLVEYILSITSLKENDKVKKIVYDWIENNEVEKIKSYILFTVDCHKYLSTIKEKINKLQITDWVKYLKKYFDLDIYDNNTADKKWDKTHVYNDELLDIYVFDNGMYFSTHNGTSKDKAYSIMIIKEN